MSADPLDPIAARALELRAVLALCAMTESGFTPALKARSISRMPVSRQITTFAACALELRVLLAGAIRGDAEALALARLLTTDNPIEGDKR